MARQIKWLGDPTAAPKGETAVTDETSAAPSGVEGSAGGEAGGGGSRTWYGGAVIDGQTVKLGDAVALQPLASDPTPKEPTLVLLEGLYQEGGIKRCTVRSLWRPKDTFVGEKLEASRFPEAALLRDVTAM